MHLQSSSDSSPPLPNSPPPLLPLSTDNKLLSNPKNNFQQSSLLTASPAERLGTDIKNIEQKTLLPFKPILAQLNSQGEIHINITVPANLLTLGRLLGEGGYGSVYEGLYNGKKVAIKRIKAQHLTTEAIEELRKEAEIMFQLGVDSDYIVPLKRVCLESPHYSLVMSLMQNGSLYNLLHNGQELPWTIRFQIALDAAYGLADLHEYKILHRDLKSLNILLDDRLRAKLADFGLAKIKRESSSQSSVAKGTVLWMAPELFEDEPKMTTASDIYSFGMVLWELLTRMLPYTKASNQMVAARWIEKGKKEEIPSDCPPELKSIIESCWESPMKRPTAIQVAERLKPLVVSAGKQKQLSLSPLPELKKLSVQEEDTRDQEIRQLKAEITRLEQQLQSQELELKRSSEEKKSIPVPIPTSQNQQGFLPMPKKIISIAQSPEQGQLQYRLITACKQGDEKTVISLLQQGAKADMASPAGEQPLGAAIWGMNPAVVHALIQQAGGVAAMNWEECEKHNKERYNDTFIVPRSAHLEQHSGTFGDWLQFLKTIEPSPFLRDYHLNEARKHWRNDTDSSSWENLKKHIDKQISSKDIVLEAFDSLFSKKSQFGGFRIRSETEKGYEGFRIKIKQEIQSASQQLTLAMLTIS